jgi:hypothetical protein
MPAKLDLEIAPVVRSYPADMEWEALDDMVEEVDDKLTRVPSSMAVYWWREPCGALYLAGG